MKHFITYEDPKRCSKPEECKRYEPNRNEFCARIPLSAIMNPNERTLNSKLTGTANPRTLIKPAIPAPSHDLEFWRQNPSYFHSQINKKTPMVPNWAGFDVPENATGKDAGSPAPYGSGHCRMFGGCEGDILWDTEIHDPSLIPIQPNVYTSTDQFQPINANMGISMTPQFPNTTIEGGFPPSGGAGQGNEIFFDTNRRRHVVEDRPFVLLSDEKGSSEERYSLEDGGGPITRAPRREASHGTDVFFEEPCHGQDLRDGCDKRFTAPEGVYDGRFTGYGASDRSYVDKLLGQPKYYYEDVNAIRQPNYLVRSKLDSCLTPFGDSYGQLNDGHKGLADVKQCAERAWVQNSLDFRTNLSKSLMRKVNEEQLQRRIAPKYTLRHGAAGGKYV